MRAPRHITLIAIIAAMSLVMFLAACAGEPDAPTTAPAATIADTATTAPTAAVTTAPPATAVIAPTKIPAATPTPTKDPEPIAATYVLTFGQGTVARYKVEEVLANTGFKVATGETTDVSGQVVMEEGGPPIVAGLSSIVVQAATLRTDSNRRDGYVRNRTLQTDTYPEVVFRPTSAHGLPDLTSRPDGQVAFTITGDLTVRAQTREVTWDATADFTEYMESRTVTGSASVEFTFDDFGMNKPSVAIVLSVDDTIRLELDFVGAITAQ